MKPSDLENSLKSLAGKFNVNSCQLSVIRLLCQGDTQPGIAQKLDLSLNTVKTYVKRLYWKLDVHNRTQFINAVSDAVPPPADDP